MLVPDVPALTTIATDPQPDIGQPVNAVVEVTCTVDAHPPPYLTLFLSDADGSSAIYNHPDPALSFTTSITLTEGDIGDSFFCRAEGGTPEDYRVDSESVIFNILCRCLIDILSD